MNNNGLYHHIRTLGSMQAGSVDFVSNVLPLTTRSYSPISTEQMPSDSTSFIKLIQQHHHHHHPVMNLFIHS